MLSLPTPTEDHLAKVGALEPTIFERQHIIIDRAKSAVWPVLHAVGKTRHNAATRDAVLRGLACTRSNGLRPTFLPTDLTI
jgi:hypothetical protein